MSKNDTVEVFYDVMFCGIFIFRDLGARGWNFETAAVITIAVKGMLIFSQILFFSLSQIKGEGTDFYED